ncbi:MAG: ATP-dependent DNA helicase RecG, partial [Chloroflexi bacterium]|nr:ATP-dependent DNA helicase RecG [Chloroflexota bacterium]
MLKRSPDQDLARLQQILRLEERNGYADRAVIGGLDRFLESWIGNNQGFPAPSPGYGRLSPAQRSRWAAELLQWLAGARPATSVKAAAASSRERGAAPLSATRASAVKAHQERPSAPLAAPPAARARRASTLTLDSPLESLPGLRRDAAARLKRLGLEIIRDALYHFPHRHLDFSQRVPIAQLIPGAEQTVSGFVWEAREVQLGRRMRGAEVTIGDDTGNVRAIWFNQPYLARTFRAGAQVVLSGKVSFFRGKQLFESPEYEVQGDAEEDLVHTGRLVPIYPLTEGLSGRTVRRILKQVVDGWADRVEDPLPEDLRTRRSFLPLPLALKEAHYPGSWESLEEARQRLAFDELFAIQLGALSRQQEWQGAPGYVVPAEPRVLEGFRASLPFRLTPAQEQVLREITQDLASGRPMSRLLQGDVGSGKTVIAAAALVLAVAAGYQGALMAPTEILAEQHYRGLSRLFGQPDFMALAALPLPYLERLGRPLRLGLLTGSLRARDKEELRSATAAGALDILVGTHALIQEEVAFLRLALAVIDEQHRFGVAQRATLRQKSAHPHVLVMTATPIPRTLALTMYADLESSVIDQLPPGRQPIQTFVVEPDKRERAYRFLREQVTTGRQAFIICPLIEEYAVLEARAATAEHQRLSTEVYPDLRLGLLHGRMPPTEKDQVMERFHRGELDILVSTTVVEVGI